MCAPRASVSPSRPTLTSACSSDFDDDGAAGADAEARAGEVGSTAIGINQTIGSAIFLLPSQVAALAGNWSPIMFVAIGFASLLVALCFAEVGSRFEGTGGPYLYTKAAFGRFAGFEVGWMQWVTRVTSQAGIVNAIALALGSTGRR
jgi:amino acid transporter